MNESAMAGIREAMANGAGKENFGEWFAKRCKQLGISQWDVLQNVGITSSGAVSGWKRGVGPSARNRAAVEAILNAVSKAVDVDGKPVVEKRAIVNMSYEAWRKVGKVVAELDPTFRVYIGEQNQ